MKLIINSSITIPEIKELVRQLDLALFFLMPERTITKNPGHSGLLAFALIVDSSQNFPEIFLQPAVRDYLKEIRSKIELLILESATDDSKYKHIVNDLLLLYELPLGNSPQTYIDVPKSAAIISELNKQKINADLIYSPSTKQVFAAFDDVSATNFKKILQDKLQVEFKASSVDGKVHITCINQNYDKEYDQSKIEALYKTFPKKISIEFCRRTHVIPDTNSRLQEIDMFEIKAPLLENFRELCGASRLPGGHSLHISFKTTYRKPHDAALKYGSLERLIIDQTTEESLQQQLIKKFFGAISEKVSQPYCTLK